MGVQKVYRQNIRKTSNATNPYFSQDGEVIALGFGFTGGFLDEWNNRVYCRVKIISGRFKGQARIRHCCEKCGLGPGRANCHVLEAIGGSWETATVNGDLRNEGWGAELGYPGIDLNEYGGEVNGFLFTSDNLSDQWELLDQFEGESYERILKRVKLKDGALIEAYIYTLRSA